MVNQRWLPKQSEHRVQNYSQRIGNIWWELEKVKYDAASGVAKDWNTYRFW